MVDSKPPRMGQIVLFEANDGSGTLSPAIVLRTKGDVVRDMERVGPYMDVDIAFPNKYLADLLVFNPGGQHYEQRVPYHPRSRDRMKLGWVPAPGTTRRSSTRVRRSVAVSG